MNYLNKIIIFFCILIFSLSANAELTVKDLKKTCKDLKNQQAIQENTLLLHKDLNLEIKKDPKNLIDYFCIKDKEDKDVLIKSYSEKIKDTEKFDKTQTLPLNKNIKIKKNKEYVALEAKQNKALKQAVNKKLESSAKDKLEGIASYIKNLNEFKKTYSEKFNKFINNYNEFKKISKSKEVEFKNFITNLKSNPTADNKSRWEVIEDRIKDVELKLNKIKAFKLKLEKNLNKYESLEKKINNKKTEIENDPRKAKFKDTFSFEVNIIKDESNTLDNQILTFDNSLANLTVDLENITELTLKKEVSLWDTYKFTVALILSIIFLIVSIIFLILYLSSLKKVNELKDFQDKLLDQIEQLKKSSNQQFSNLASNLSRSAQSRGGLTGAPQRSSSPSAVKTNSYDEVVFDFLNTLDNFELVGQFQSKWIAKGFSRKERQDGGKTTIIPSQRSFEKAEIWVIDLQDQSIGLPGIIVKQNMSTYMNLDFEKAQRDFRGIFDVSSGSVFTCRMNAKLQKAGPSYTILQKGKIEFPG